jgi:hypothetical protein
MADKVELPVPTNFPVNHAKSFLVYYNINIDVTLGFQEKLQVAI